MKRSIFLLLTICFLSQASDAQLWKLKRWEGQLGLGPTFSFPDIGGYTIGKNALGFRDLSYRQTSLGINANMRYRLSRTANLRLSLVYGWLHSTDVRGSNEGRQFRATTSLFEPSFLLEYYFIKNRYESSYLFLKGKSLWAMLTSLDFYAFAGFGGVSYSVTGNEDLVNHGFVDGGFAPVVPVGIGASLIYTPNVNFGLELGGRHAFTDYIDGYTSQYSKANDVYYFLNFTLIYKFKSSPKGWPTLR